MEILALSIDSREMLEKIARQVAADGIQLMFPLLSDPGHKVIDRYGLLNPTGRGWPHPTMYVIDKRGVVRWKFIEIDYKVRPTNEMVLAALGKLDKITK